jgi:hypothetical protein
MAERFWQGIRRALHYAVPLLGDAIVYLGRVSLDLVGRARVLLLGWLANRNPAQSTEYVEKQAAVRARRAERWTSWRELTTARRAQVRIVAATLAFAALLAVRGLLGERSVATPSGPAGTNVVAVASSAQLFDEPSPATVSRDPSVSFLEEIKTASPTQWLVLDAAALEAGDRGEWDDFRVGSPVVMKDAGTTRYRMWYVGCRFAMSAHGCGIGHATSGDGAKWAKANSPVFVPPDLPAPNWIGAVAVVKRADGYLMWYSIDGNPFADRPRGTLHMATSTDGLAWQNVGHVLTTGSDGTRSIKHVIHDDGTRFHLWYFDVPADGADESLIHLTSIDGKTWTSAGGEPFDGRAASVGRPWVTSDDGGGFRALLVDYREGAALRWLTSGDGTLWTAGEIERGVRVAFDGRSIVAATGLKESDGLWLWLTLAVADRRATESIGVAFKKRAAS